MERISFLLHFFFNSYTTSHTSNGTFEVPRNRLGREVAIGLHKSRCAHREPGVDTVIGEVVVQVAFQEFVNFFDTIYKLFDNMTELHSKKKNSLCPPKDLLVGGSLAASEYPQCVTFSAVPKKRKKKIKKAVKEGENND